MSITGDLSVMIEALGKPFGDPHVLEALTLVGLPIQRNEYQIGAVDRTYYVAEGRMAEFLFEDDLLRTVMIHTVADADHGRYPTPDTLIDGLSGNAPRAEVLERFGTPEWTNNESADRFQVEGGYVRFGYLDGLTCKINAMLSVPGR